MADEPTPQNSGSSRQRRSSIVADLFGGGRASASRPTGESGSPPANQQYSGPISQAAANAQRRRLSVTTLGLSGSPNQSSPFNNFRHEGRDSISSANSGSLDESAIGEDEAPGSKEGSAPSTPFARRTSFGARALRDIRTTSFGGGGGGGNGGGGVSPGQNGTKSPPANNDIPASKNHPPHHSQTQSGTISSRDHMGRGPERFNWSDNFRSRAERTASISGQGGAVPPPPGHTRAASVATMEPPPAAEIPKPKEPVAAKGGQRPDHFQERILKGDFYMD